MTESPRFSFTIRTPQAEARTRRRVRAKRAAIAAGLMAALLTPGTADMIAPGDCATVWVC